MGGSEWGRRVRQLREDRFGSMVVDKERFIGGMWRYKLNLASIPEGMVEKIMDLSVESDLPQQCLTPAQMVTKKRLQEYDVSLLSTEQCEALRDFLDNLQQIELPLS